LTTPYSGFEIIELCDRMKLQQSVRHVWFSIENVQSRIDELLSWPRNDIVFVSQPVMLIFNKKTMNVGSI